jgi:hypothetical protein
MVSPEFHLGYRASLKELGRRLQGRPPGLIQVLTGPRQVGKTTLLLDLARHLGPRAVYAAGDGPEEALPGSWERIWVRAGEIAGTHGRAVVFLDEIQRFGDWAGKLKGEWDRIQRRRDRIHVVISGSSSLRLARGSRESLAGRFEKITLTHWSASAAAAEFRLGREEAAELSVRRGLYPGAFRLLKDPARWAAYVRDSIVEPAIGRDLLALAPVRRPALLRQVFATAMALPARIVSLQKLQGRLEERGALETIAHYLDLLEDAYLVAPLDKHTARPSRRRAAPPKLVPLNNALLAVTDPRGSPDPVREPERYGVWVENACLAFAWNAGQRVAYWREEPLEVDGVIEGSWGSWALEIKTGRFGAADLHGLLEFVRRFPAYRPLVICADREIGTAERLGIPAVTWRHFLLEGLSPPKTRG